MPPPGGPADVTPPWLAVATPESATFQLGPIDELRFTFSEKMDRVDAYRWLNVYPKRTIRGTSWKGATTAIVRLEEPLPADTTVVVEIVPGMKDKHGVPQPLGRTYVFATGDTIYDGELYGELVLEDKPLAGGVVEIIPAGPDSVPLAQRPILRRATTDSTGAWRLPWLPATGERWLLWAYHDPNNDRRRADTEAQRLFPDTLQLTPEQPRLALGLRIIYAPTTPGQLTGALADRPDSAGVVFAFTATIAESDTGYAGAAQPATSKAGRAVPDTGLFTLTDAGPGLVRAVFFVDLDGDSLLSAFGDTVDTMWALEPWALVDSAEVEPGLPTAIASPVWPDTLTPWPAPARVDTLVAAPDDSLAALAADSLAIMPADSLAAVPADSLATAEGDTASTPEE